MTTAKNIRVLELREITLAKVEYKDSFQGIGKAYGKLMNWARANGFSNSKTNKTLTIYHDDPKDDIRACIAYAAEVIQSEKVIRAA